MCESHRTWESCVSQSSLGCVWCPSSFSCLSNKSERPSNCLSNDSICDSVDSCKGVASSITFPEEPEWAPDTCKNNGVFDWSSNDKGTRVGAAYCNCPKGWDGGLCSICKDSSVCPRGYTCSHNLDPKIESNSVSVLNIGCNCNSKLCLDNQFGPGLGYVNIQVATDKKTNTATASFDILKAVKYPLNENFDKSQIDSPFVIKAKLYGCEKKFKNQYIDTIPCSQICAAGKVCVDGVPWNANDQCVVWTCDTKDTKKFKTRSSTLCPPDKPWAVNKDNCNTIQAVMSEPFELVCTVPSENDPGSVKCGFKTPLLPHGTIALTCDIGTCIKSSDVIVSNETSTSNEFWCTNNFNACRNAQYFMIFSIPLAFFICLLVFYFVNDFRQKRFERTLMQRPKQAVPSIANTNEVREESSNESVELSEKNLGSDALHQESLDMLSNSAVSIEDGISPGPGIASSSSPLSSATIYFSNITYSYSSDDSCATSICNKVASLGKKRNQLQDQSLAGSTNDLDGSINSPLIGNGNSHGSSKVTRTVLQNVTGYVGVEMMAILGPSGSGKTSFIDIIAGRKNQGYVTGDVFINGKKTTSSERRKKIGYVMQDDHSLPGTSTVREYLMFHANMRLHKSSLLEKCERVQSVIEELGLMKSAESPIGDQFKKSLSGGEKRRVSIAVEILSKCELLVLDEPTSGLDSTSTKTVIDSLRNIIRKDKKGVVMSIHQPSSLLWQHFDRILLLSSRGETLFCGPRTSLIEFASINGFGIPENYNPAEYFLDLAISQDNAALMLDRYEKSDIFDNEKKAGESLVQNIPTYSNGNTDIIQDNDGKMTKASWRTQIFHLSMRNIQKIIRHPVLASVNFVATSLVAVTAGFLYRGITNDLEGAINRAGLYFFTLTFLMLSALADLGMWQDERIVFMRERSIYEPSAFLFSKLFAEMIPLKLVPLSIFTLLLTFLVGLNQDPFTVLMLFLTLLLVSLISTLMFLSIGMFIKSSAVANFVAVLWSMYCLLMSGFLLQFGQNVEGSAGSSRAGLRFLQYFSFLYFAFESLMVSEMHDQSFQIVVKNPDGKEITQATVTGDLIVAQLGLDYRNYSRDITAIVIYFFLFILIVAVLLQFRVREQR